MTSSHRIRKNITFWDSPLGWVDGGIRLQQYAYDRERELYLRDIGLRVLRFASTEVEHNLPGRGYICHFTGMSAASGRSQIGELKPAAEEHSLLDVIFYGQKPTTSPFLAERVSILIQGLSKHGFQMFRALG